MKTIGKVAAAIAIAALHWCVTAATIEVATVAELTNAVARANAGEKIGGEAIDTIRLMKSGSPYRFTDEKMDSSNNYLLSVNNVALTIEGEDSSPRQTWTDGDEPVIIDGNSLGCIIRFASGSKNKEIRNLCFTGGRRNDGGAVRGEMVGMVTATNCVFRQNSTAGGNGAAARWVVLRDCLVKECKSGTAVVGGDASQIFYAYGCDFVGNAKGVATFSFNAYDCTFDSNTNTADAVIGSSAVLYATNCTFKGNYGPAKYIVRGKTFVDCDFTGNNAQWMIHCDISGGKVAGCKFRGNEGSVLTVYGTGGALQSDSSLVVTNCQFIENTASQTASESGSQYVKAVLRGIVNDVDRCAIYDSVFSNNYYNTSGTSHGLSSVIGAHAVRCSFAAGANAPSSSFSPDIDRYNDAANNSHLEECDIAAGELRSCVVDRCTIHDLTNKEYCVFRDYTRASNTLVERCKSPLGKGGLYVVNTLCPFDAQFVNCTFVSNALLIVDAIYNNYSVSNGCHFSNCMFYGNRTPGGTITDIAIRGGNDTVLRNFTNYVDFAYSYYGKFTAAGTLTDAVFATITNAPNTLALCENPCFVKDSRPDAPYWSLLPRSPLIGKGDPLGFSASDRDLAGRFRLKDGKVDPGCYQCWINPPGMAIIVR